MSGIYNFTRGGGPVGKLAAEFFALDHELTAVDTAKGDCDTILESWLLVAKTVAAIEARSRSERKGKAAILLAVHRRLSPPGGLFSDLSVSLANDTWGFS
jgi:hypothetical protein